MGHATTIYYEQTIAELQHMLDKVRALHQVHTFFSPIDRQNVAICDNCHQDWPCETVDTLDGNK